MIPEQPLTLRTPGRPDLEAALAMPPGATGGVVVCHPHPQYGGDMDNPVVVTAARAAARAGLATLRFNFRGVGASAGVWEGTAAIVGEVLDPIQLEMAVMTTLVTTMVLLSLPEPISKAVVLTMTLCMVAYVGWDTVVGLITGWKRMDQEAKLARTFADGSRQGEARRQRGQSIQVLVVPDRGFFVPGPVA